MITCFPEMLNLEIIPNDMALRHRVEILSEMDRMTEIGAAKLARRHCFAARRQNSFTPFATRTLWAKKLT